jgi:hypothetical protein
MVVSSKVYELVLIVFTAYPLPLLGTRRNPRTVGTSTRVETVKGITTPTISTTGYSRGTGRTQQVSCPYPPVCPYRPSRDIACQYEVKKGGKLRCLLLHDFFFIFMM